MPTNLEAVRGTARIPIIDNGSADDSASVLMVHGIFSEKTEDGRFTRLSGELAALGIGSWQFDLTGHGDSPTPSELFTASAAIADFKIVSDRFLAERPGPHHLIASSFGGSVVLLAFAAGLVDPQRFARIVLLNPVTDYRSSFLEPFGEQMQEIFTPEALAGIVASGAHQVREDFVLGLPALVDFELLHPATGLRAIARPTLVLHGTADTAVSHDVVQQDCAGLPDVSFESVEGAAHAFAEPTYERITFDRMIEFLT